MTHRHCQGHRAAPQESSHGSRATRCPPAPPRRTGHKAQLQGQAHLSSPSNRAATAHRGAWLRWQGVLPSPEQRGQGKAGLPGHALASSGSWAVQPGVDAGERALSRSRLAQQWPKRGEEPKINLGKGGRGIENIDTNVLGKGRAEGLDAGGHKPQPAAASTASRQHRQRSHSARPATSGVGSSPPAAVLSHSAETWAHGTRALLWHGQAAGHSSLPSAAAAGTPLKTTRFHLSQLGLRGKPNFSLSPGSTSTEGLLLWSLFLGQRVT